MDKLNRLREIGEKEIVKKIQFALGDSPLFVSERGNDSTALDIGLPNDYLLVTCDRCPTPLAYKINKSNLDVWGRLAITCVATDLFASGGKPFAFLVSLLLNRNMSEEEVLIIVNSAKISASHLGAYIVAGDTKEASEINIVTTGLALVPKDKLITRKQARVGDVAVITGTIGKFTASQALLAKESTFSNLDKELIDAVMYPIAPYASAVPFLNNVTPSAGMDISDGLLCTLFTICDETGLGIDINEAELPIPEVVRTIANKMGISPLRFAFGTGDWQVVYAVDPATWQDYQKKHPLANIHSIGHFTSEPGVRLKTQDFQSLKLNRIEQQHFLDTWADRGYLEYLLTIPLFLE